MSADSNAFTFELKESLFFEKGQEVEEIRGISLEPEISIHAYEDYISIRGAIELQGEYQKVPYVDEEEESLDFDDIQAKRYVENIEEVNGLYVFSHAFPVEISVPPYRVENLDDVTVNIESFDYELVEVDRLKVYATIDIQGIQQDSSANEEYAREPQEEEAQSFSFEIEHPVEEKEEKEEKEEVALERNSTDSTEIIEDVTEVEEVEKDQKVEDVQEDPDRWKIKSQTLSDYFQSLAEPNEEPELVEDAYMDVEGVYDDVEDYVDDDGDDYDDVVEDVVDRDEDPEDVTYLSDIFRNAEEEQYTKMRLCIVQQDDTIETIAQRFSISPLQLIKHNQLESDFEVNEGELLYIPPK